MKYIIHIVLVFLLLNVSVKALSLKEAVNDSLSNNLSLKIEAINVDMAEEDYLQSTTDYFPTITLSGSMSENDYSDIKSLEVLQMVTSYPLAVNLLFFHKMYLVVLVDFIVHSPQRNNCIFKILPNLKSRKT